MVMACTVTLWVVTIRKLAVFFCLWFWVGKRQTAWCCWVRGCHGNTPRAIILVAADDVYCGTLLSIIACLGVDKYCGIFQIVLSYTHAVLKECLLIWFNTGSFALTFVPAGLGVGVLASSLMQVYWWFWNLFLFFFFFVRWNFKGCITFCSCKTSIPTCPQQPCPVSSSIRNRIWKGNFGDP